MEIAKEYMNRLPALRIVDASDKKGQAHARNIGVRFSRAESVVFCDADDEVAPGWVAAIGNALIKHDFVASRTAITKLNPEWVLKSRSNPQEAGVQSYTYPPYLHHAGGGTIGVKRELFESVGGFDESLPYLEDTDFSWKLQLMGIQLHFVPEAVIQLRFRDSLNGIFRQARNYAEYNVKLYKKYIPKGMPKIPLKDDLASWKNFFVAIIKNLPRARKKSDAAIWAWRFGWRWGQLIGMIKYRILAINV